MGRTIPFVTVETDENLTARRVASNNGALQHKIEYVPSALEFVENARHPSG